ncbi:hypothetical protein Hanom_Chr04g00319821 [Helianthus anomalus]
MHSFLSAFLNSVDLYIHDLKRNKHNKQALHSEALDSFQASSSPVLSIEFPSPALNRPLAPNQAPVSPPETRNKIP